MLHRFCDLTISTLKAGVLYYSGLSCRRSSEVTSLFFGGSYSPIQW